MLRLSCALLAVAVGAKASQAKVCVVDLNMSDPLSWTPVEVQKWIGAVLPPDGWFSSSRANAVSAVASLDVDGEVFSSLVEDPDGLADLGITDSDLRNVLVDAWRTAPACTAMSSAEPARLIRDKVAPARAEEDDSVGNGWASARRPGAQRGMRNRKALTEEGIRLARAGQFLEASKQFEAAARARDGFSTDALLNLAASYLDVARHVAASPLPESDARSPSQGGSKGDSVGLAAPGARDGVESRGAQQRIGQQRLGKGRDDPATGFRARVAIRREAVAEEDGHDV